jgi:SAM-dependent methyltransferase
MIMLRMTKYYPEVLFGGFTNIDGTVAFYSRVSALIAPDSVVIDAGCGRGAHVEDQVRYRRCLRNWRGRVKHVIGIDVDPGASTNPLVDEFRLLNVGGPWPVGDDVADVVVSDCVVEHLPDPQAFFGEAFRVLKVGGVLCLRTSNAWSYVGLISRLIPNALHARVLGKAQAERKPEDVFPTLYRCNSAWRLRRMLRAAGFQAVVFGYEAEPRYLEFSGLAYFLGVLHQRFAPSALRLSLFAFAAKEPDGRWEGKLII